MVPTKALLSVLIETQELLLREYATTQSFLKSVLAKANELIFADNGFIGLAEIIDGKRFIVIEPDQSDVFGVKSGDWDAKLTRHGIGGEELPSNERSFTGYVAATKRPRLAKDVRKEKFYRATNQKTLSELAVPILLDNELLGVVNLESNQLNFFTQEHRRLLTFLAKLIARPLHSRMAHEGLRSLLKPVPPYSIR